MSVPKSTKSVKGATPTPKNKIDFEKPVRPKKADFSTEEELQKARAKYKENVEKYEEKLDVWAKEQVPKTTMSKKDFSVWATKHDVSIYGSIDGLDENVLGSWSKRFEKLSSDFPQVQEYYQKTLRRNFEVSFNPSSTFNAEGSHGMTFGGSFADMTSGAKNFGSGIAEGLFTKGTGTIEALYDHEFGHNLDSAIRFGKIKTTEQRVKYSNDIVSLLYGKKGMSEYATTNADELFAEGFSAWYGGEKTEFAESFGELLKRWL
jgi:hypothetical protein